MRASITETLISKLKPKPKPYEIRDTKLPGFFLRVQPSGAMSYYVELGRGRRMAIGKVAVLKLPKARAKADELLSKFTLGEDPLDARKEAKAHTLRSYLDERYKPWAESHLRHVDDAMRKLASWYPEFGNTKLPEITTWNIEKQRASWLKSGSTVATCNRKIAYLKAALSNAVRWKIIKTNPASEVKLMKEDHSGNIRYLSAEEDKRLRKALEAREKKRRENREKYNVWRRERGYSEFPPFGNYTDHLKPMVLLALNTGMRRGELFNLSWPDINFVRRLVTVIGKRAKSLQTRHIPLNDEAYAVLQKWHEQEKDSELVFPSRDGNRMDNINKSWEHLMKDAKVQNFRFHDCRHDFASKLVMQGVDLNTVRELLGHSDIKMTLRYAHLAPEKLAAAVAKLNGK